MERGPSPVVIGYPCPAIIGIYPAAIAGIGPEICGGKPVSPYIPVPGIIDPGTVRFQLVVKGLKAYRYTYILRMNLCKRKEHKAGNKQ